MSAIRTPDQRLRVFISSTINELTGERKAVREVIERLKLTPVYFESGARPHPARDLYRSYLDQSDIFVGIYWKSYGWVAPDMDISGLEDEWKLSLSKPKLIYIKHATERDVKLEALLSDIQKSDTVCYQKFETEGELAELLANDIAILMTERFQTHVADTENHTPLLKTNLPTIRSEIIGRSNELKQITEKLTIPELGLITLTGPGGTGKTRLALEVGKQLLNRFTDGVYFVSLGSITESERTPGVIAQSIGMNNNGVKDVAKWVLEYLFDKSILLILDNFEQIIDAGIFVSQILNKCPLVKIIVTSRTPLYIRNEHLFPVTPLEVKPFAATAENHAEAVQLFIQLAKEFNPSLEWTDENIAAAYSICNKVDGLPLAIELTAARCRRLSPFQLDKKLDRILTTILPGPRDYPERQQTLRNTIQWSYDLLDKTDQRLFHRLSVFQNGWSYEAVEKVCWQDFNETESLDDSLDRLTDYGLVVQLPSEYMSYRLLQVIKEYADEKLIQLNEKETIKEFHCNYYQTLAAINSQKTWTNPVNTKHLHFREDYENIIAALEYALEKKDVIKVLSLLNYLNALYMMTGEIGFLFELLDRANIKSDTAGIERMQETIPKNLLAFSFLSAGFTRSTTGYLQEGLRDLSVAIKFSKEVNIPHIEAFALLFMGIAKLTLSLLDEAKEHLLQSISLQKKLNLLSGQLTAEITLHNIYIEENKIDEAIELLDNAIVKSQTAFMPLVHSYALYERGYVHNYVKEYDLALEMFRESSEINKKYKLNFNATFPLLGMALVHTELNNFETAFENFKKSLACIRASANNIEYECFNYAFCFYLAKSGQSEKALLLYSFIKNSGNKTIFRPWITQNYCLVSAYKLISGVYNESYIIQQIDNTTEISREDIYAMLQ